MRTYPSLPAADDQSVVDQYLRHWNKVLKQDLLLRNISLETLADRLDISYGTLCKRLRSDSPWPLEHYLLLQRHFCLPDVRDCGTDTAVRYERVDPGTPI